MLQLLPRLPRLGPRSPPFHLASSSMASSPKAVAEYAKSGRSSCKGCGKAIPVGSLRLGLVARDTRGFDATKWHHLGCFRPQHRPLDPVEEIQGFSSLQNADQEALREMDFAEPANEAATEVRKRDDIEIEEAEEKSPKKPKVRKRGDTGGEESKNKGTEEPEKVVGEYAKSSRSTCKSCGEAISLGTLRLGLVNKDPRGFEMTKWHHSSCFRPQSGLLDSVEEIKGFSSLKSYDQEMLRKLESAGQSERTTRELSRADKKDELDIAFSVSDIKNEYKDATLAPKWKAFRTVIFREQDDDLHHSEKVAAFDFDGCLVNTSVKRVGPDAWSLMYPMIPEKLRILYDGGYKLVIFTNESNIERWKNKRQQAVDSKIGRLDNFIKLVKVPMQVFIACGLEKSKDQTEDPFRKPKPGMWRLMEDHFNSGIAIDMDQSFYVGDAAGRANDHSDADSKFAQAIGLKFHVPEEYFGA